MKRSIRLIISAIALLAFYYTQLYGFVFICGAFLGSVVFDSLEVLFSLHNKK